MPLGSHRSGPYFELGSHSHAATQVILHSNQSVQAFGQACTAEAEPERTAGQVALVHSGSKHAAVVLWRHLQHSAWAFEVGRAVLLLAAREHAPGWSDLVGAQVQQEAAKCPR